MSNITIPHSVLAQIFNYLINFNNDSVAIQVMKKLKLISKSANSLIPKLDWRCFEIEEDNYRTMLRVLDPSIEYSNLDLVVPDVDLLEKVIEEFPQWRGKIYPLQFDLKDESSVLRLESLGVAQMEDLVIRDCENFGYYLKKEVFRELKTLSLGLDYPIDLSVIPDDLTCLESVFVFTDHPLTSFASLSKFKELRSIEFDTSDTLQLDDVLSLLQVPFVVEQLAITGGQLSSGDIDPVLKALSLNKLLKSFKLNFTSPTTYSQEMLVSLLNENKTLRILQLGGCNMAAVGTKIAIYNSTLRSFSVSPYIDTTIAHPDNVYPVDVPNVLECWECTSALEEQQLLSSLEDIYKMMSTRHPNLSTIKYWGNDAEDVPPIEKMIQLNSNARNLEINIDDSQNEYPNQVTPRMIEALTNSLPSNTKISSLTVHMPDIQLMECILSVKSSLRELVVYSIQDRNVFPLLDLIAANRTLETIDISLNLDEHLDTEKFINSMTSIFSQNHQLKNFDIYCLSFYYETCDDTKMDQLIDSTVALEPALHLFEQVISAKYQNVYSICLSGDKKWLQILKPFTKILSKYSIN